MSGWISPCTTLDMTLRASSSAHQAYKPGCAAASGSPGNSRGESALLRLPRSAAIRSSSSTRSSRRTGQILPRDAPVDIVADCKVRCTVPCRSNAGLRILAVSWSRSPIASTSWGETLAESSLSRPRSRHIVRWCLLPSQQRSGDSRASVRRPPIAGPRSAPARLSSKSAGQTRSPTTPGSPRRTCSSPSDRATRSWRRSVRTSLAVGAICPRTRSP